MKQDGREAVDTMLWKLYGAWDTHHSEPVKVGTKLTWPLSFDSVRQLLAQVQWKVCVCDGLASAHSWVPGRRKRWRR